MAEHGQLPKLTSSIISNWADRIHKENLSDPWIIEKGEKTSHGDSDPAYLMRGGILYYKNKFCLDSTSNLRRQVLDKLPGSKGGGHSGYYRTLRRVRQNFFLVRDEQICARFCGTMPGLSTG